MSDFGELCPLFETGVYSEVSFPMLHLLSGISVSCNILQATITADSSASCFSFGRTVVVTGAYVQRYGTNHTEECLKLGHCTSGPAAATVFGSATITTTLSVFNEWTQQPFEMTGSKTFTSNEVLSLAFGTVTETHNGFYSLIVRYREK